MLKLTEMESLEDNLIGLRKAKRLTLDLSDPAIKTRLLQEILQSIYGESEIEYLITIVKYK